MGKSGGHAETAAAERHRPNGPDVVTAAASLGDGAGAAIPTVRERLRSRDLTVKVFVAGGTYVALAWVNQVWAVVGAVLSPVVSDLIRDYVERHRWSLRRLRRGAVATVLLGHEEDAYAARRRAAAGWRRRIPASLVAGAATVSVVVAGVALAGAGQKPPPGGGDSGHTTPGPDPIPAQVTGVHGASPTTKAPVIEWRAVPGARRYIVFRNGRRVGVRTGRRFVDRTAAHGILTYTVAAEAGGRTGPQSTGRTIRYRAAAARVERGSAQGPPVLGGYEPPPPPPPPPPPARLPGKPVLSAGYLVTNAPPRFTWAPVKYATSFAVYRNGTRTTTPNNSFAEPVSLRDGMYTYQVSGINSQGDEGPKSDPLSFVVDTAPPVTPLRFRFTSSSTTGPPTMSWHAVADAAGGYIVLPEGRTSVPVSGTTYSDPYAPIGVVSRYQVEAVDQAGNVSAPSGAIEIIRTG